MRISRIYQAGIYQVGDTVSLNDSASHHLSRVLRQSVGDEVRLFNGEGVECIGEIIVCEKRQVSVEVTSLVTPVTESPLSIHLFQGMSKSDKMDFSIQKAVELGVTEITPVMTARTQFKMNAERLAKKRGHWQGVIVSACEQSGRATLPCLNEAIVFDKIDFARLPTLSIMLDPTGDLSFNRLTTDGTQVALFIGPEGGFSEGEMAKAKENNIQRVQCGPRILRTETAGLVAISLLQHHFGDL